MKKMKRFLALVCLCLMAVSLPVSATETTATEAPTLPPLIVGVRELSGIPESWNPLEARDADQEAILALTSEPLYRLGADGVVMPVQAAALPVDVTAEFAGRYGIPGDEVRGYAFAIELREGIFWDDGVALTASDWLYTIEKQMEQNVFPLEISNYQAYLRGDTGPAEQIISLMDAGYGSLEEAEEAGIRDFYVDTTHFWGLDTGWCRATDRTRLFDAAIPSGCEEMYVTPAYLFREYLSSTGSQTMFQSEFVGIPVQNGASMTMDDVGLFVYEDKLVLILQAQTTATHVALALSGLYPVPQGTDAEHYGTAANYHSCGQYRVDSVSDQEIILIPNPHWTGETAEFDWIRCE